MIAATPTVTILTSITDGYDTLKRVMPQHGINVEFVAITDGKEEREDDHGWELLDVGEYVRPTPEDTRHPNRLAKIAKCQPWKFSHAPYSIWIDGSYRITSPLFAFQAIKFATPIAQFIHPWRDCALDEGTASIALPRYNDQAATISAQLGEYRQIGHPPHWGLWATGVIVRKHTPDIRTFGQQWLREIRQWSYQDQVSEPVTLRLCDLRPTPLPGDHITNPWLKYEGSARHG